MKGAAPQPVPGENSGLLGEPLSPRAIAMPPFGLHGDPFLAASGSPRDPRDVLVREGQGLKGKFPRAEQTGGKSLTPGKATWKWQLSML